MVPTGPPRATAAAAYSKMMMHSDEVLVTPDVARRLITDQFPQWGDLPIRPLAADGTVHAIYRIGDGLAARFPRRGTDPSATRSLLVAEAAAARELAECSPVPTPEPVALGEPGPGYPLPWAVQTWLDGQVATDADPSGSVTFAHDLAGFVGALRACDTRGRRFSGSNRGGDLKDHDGWMETCFRSPPACSTSSRCGRCGASSGSSPAPEPT